MSNSKRILITGATAGIGLECAKQLAPGNTLVLVGRSADKLAAAREQVLAAGAESVDTEICDFASLEAIRQLAAAITQKYDHIDVLINNAGAVFASRTETRDGYESNFGVNHLAPYLLTELLKPLMIASAPSRIVITASTAHYRADLDFDDLQYRQGYGIMKAYGRSKLGNVIYARELARELSGTGVTVTALHPGAVATDIWKGAPRFLAPLLAVVKKVAMISPAEGGSRIAYLATSPEVEGVTGEYFDNNKVRQPSGLARDPEASQRLMSESARLVGLS